MDDTQAAFTDIKALIPEEERLEAAPPDSHADEPTNGTNSEFNYSSPTTSGHMPTLEHGSANDEADTGSNAGSGSIYGISPANDGASDELESADEKDDQDEDGAAEKAVPPTLTFNEKVREVQGDRMLTQH